MVVDPQGTEGQRILAWVRLQQSGRTAREADRRGRSVTTPPASTRTPQDQATIAAENAPPEPTPPPAGLASARRRSELMMVQPALPASQRVVRHSVARWLEGAHWPEDGVEDITVAVTEAVTNVIEHAYLDHDPGAIHLYAWITPMADPALIPAARPTTPDGRPVLAAPPPPTGNAATRGRKVIIVVSDRGRWDPQRRTVDLNGHRGRGIAMMTALMAAIHIQRSSNGTAVVLVSPVSPG
jgi:anti-sigma regulatory factor (Ser/Thr protein kinase)